MTRLHHCRSCGSSDLTTVLDLGAQPIANALVDPSRAPRAEDLHPLAVAFCAECALVQVTETIPPAVLFGQDYPYYSSVSPALLDHSRAHAEELLAQRRLGPDSFVVEVASNDGYLLRNFVWAGVPVLGIDPADGPAAAAERAGVRTRVAYFDADVAASVVAEHGQADVILANNVLAHVENINAFVAGFATLLKPDGIAQFEFPYLRRLIETCAFDTIYHEHVFYYSLIALAPLFARHGLHINDAEEISIHGGSLRLTVGKTNATTARLRALQIEEAALGMNSLSYYADFGRRVSKVRTDLRALVRSLVAAGNRVRAYGAAAKGATLLNYADLGQDDLGYVVDRNPHKVGKIMPGVGLPIRPVEALAAEQPEYLLVLAWNFADEIMAQQRAYALNGGRFVLPIPKPRIVDGVEAAPGMPRH